MEHKKDIKRARIIDSALTLFLKKGFHNCRIEDIAEKAQVGKGTFYLYFKNKELLVESLIEEFISETLKILVWVQENIKEGADPKETFEVEAKELYKIMNSNKKLARFFFKEGRGVSKNVDKRIHQFFEEMYDLCEFTFGIAIGENMIRKLHPRIAGVCVVGNIMNVYQAYIEGEIKDSLEVVMRETLNFNLNALGLKI